MKKAILSLVLLLSLTFVGCSTVKENVLTLEKFNQIENGMTYEQVVEIIGNSGTLSTEYGEKGTENHMVMYQYMGDEQVLGDNIGANANFSFRNNILYSKGQLYLK